MFKCFIDCNTKYEGGLGWEVLLLQSGGGTAVGFEGTLHGLGR